MLKHIYSSKSEIIYIFETKRIFKNMLAYWSYVRKQQILSFFNKNIFYENFVFLFCIFYLLVGWLASPDGPGCQPAYIGWARGPPKLALGFDPFILGLGFRYKRVRGPPSPEMGLQPHHFGMGWKPFLHQRVRHKARPNRPSGE